MLQNSKLNSSCYGTFPNISKTVSQETLTLPKGLKYKYMYVQVKRASWFECPEKSAIKMEKIWQNFSIEMHTGTYVNTKYLFLLPCSLCKHLFFCCKLQQPWRAKDIQTRWWCQFKCMLGILTNIIHCLQI